MRKITHQIIRSTSIFELNCVGYGEMHPTYDNYHKTRRIMSYKNKQPSSAILFASSEVTWSQRESSWLVPSKLSSLIFFLSFSLSFLSLVSKIRCTYTNRKDNFISISQLKLQWYEVRAKHAS